MARWTEQNRKPVDELITAWRTSCLVEDGSLREAGAVWTSDNAAVLVAEFVDKPLLEDSKTSFLDKLKQQIGDESNGVSGLMAETVAIYLAFAVTAIGPRKKRELINAILEFSGDKLDEGGIIWRGMGGGIGGPGQGFNSFRPFLVMYLVSFTEAVKKLEPEARRTLVGVDADPWAFKTWLDETLGEPKQGAQTMRNILLHLLFPDTFERTAVDEDKAQIVAKLHGVVDGLEPDGDPDLALFAIRERLKELLPEGTACGNGAIDFYYSPLREAWDPEDSRRGRRPLRSQSHLTALEQKQQVVLYGPPGTGKTYEAKRLAEQLIRRAAMERWTPTVYLQNEPAVKRLVDEQVQRRQLHPAYTYEDFIGGLRLTEGGGTEPVKGHLLKLVDRIHKRQAEPSELAPLPWILILDEINRSDLTRLLGEVFSALDDRDAEIELSAAGSDAWGPFALPADLYVIGTMNLIDQSVEQLDFALRRRFLWLLSDFRADVIEPVVEARWRALQAADTRKHLKRHPWDGLASDVELLTERAEKLNEQISASKLLGDQYRVGHTYFFDIAGFVARDPGLLSKYSHRGHYLWKKGGDALSPLLDLWSYSLEPLLEEYLAGVTPDSRAKEMKQFREAFCAPSTA